MTSRVGRALIASCACAVLFTACSGDDDSASTTRVTNLVIGGTDTTDVVTTTTIPDLTYTVQAGDSLYRIANSFCTTAADVVALNQWPEGVSHPIYPGDVILIPAPGCPVVTEAVTTTTEAPNRWLALYLNEHVITDPFDQNTPDHVNWGHVCYDAYWEAHAFAVSGGTKDALLAALAPLGGPPAEMLPAIDRWVVFSEIWYPIYVERRGTIEAEHPMFPDTEGFYRALYTDPEFLELLDAYDRIGSNAQFAAKYWVTDVCSSLFATQGSTP